MTISDLIAALEQETGPSRECDAEIQAAIDPAAARVFAPRYTASLDAALPGEDIVGTSEQKQIPGQPVYWVAVHRMPKGKMTVCGMGRTEAIARRIAYLRAREAKEKL